MTRRIKKTSNRLIHCNLRGDNCSTPHTHETSKEVGKKNVTLIEGHQLNLAKAGYG